MRTIALTFDDGPNPIATPLILDLLDKYEIKASFFLLGKRAAEYPDIARDVYSRGHLVGCHGYEHKDYSVMAEAEIAGDIDRSLQVLKKVTGTQEIRYMRPPFGGLNKAAFKVLQEQNLSLVPWSLNSFDYDWSWEGFSADELPAELIEQKKNDLLLTVLSKARKGSIVLMHDGNDENALGWQIRALPLCRALDLIITGLLDKGFEFVTVDRFAAKLFVRKYANFFLNLRK